jgi:hypothetical protein
VPLAAVVGCAVLLPPHATPIGTTVIAPSAQIDQPRIVLRDAIASTLRDAIASTLRDAIASTLRDAIASTRFSFIGKVSSDLFTTYG